LHDESDFSIEVEPVIAIKARESNSLRAADTFFMLFPSPIRFGIMRSKPEGHPQMNCEKKDRLLVTISLVAAMPLLAYWTIPNYQFCGSFLSGTISRPASISPAVTVAFLSIDFSAIPALGARCGSVLSS
jgi:hypothetical protein